MGDILRGPVDRGRITRRGADESVQDSVRTHGLVVVAAVVLTFVVCLANFALGHIGAGVAAVIAGLLVFGAGLAWLAMDRRRIRQAERDWLINHPAR
jgi:Na+-driven multidrug efflux pump